MAEPFSTFREVHRLSDGTSVVVRALLPSDRAELESALGQASRETLRSRFLSETFRPTDEMLRYLTEVDGWDHVALVATTDSLDLKSEVGVGIARFIRLADAPEAAEAAVTVDPRMRRKGLAKLLVLTLGRLAEERGSQHFRAYVLGDNEAVHAALSAVPGVIRDRDGDAWTYDLPIAERTHEPHGEGTSRAAIEAILRYVAAATRGVQVFLRGLAGRAVAATDAEGDADAEESDE